MNKVLEKLPFHHLLNYMPLVNELVKRDLKVKYRRSFLGYLWSLLNPLLMMCVMSYVFSTIFQSTIPNFPLYLICGQTLWNFFNESTSLAMHAVLHNGALIKKVYIPKFIFPFSRVLSCFVTMSFSLIAIVIVMLITRATVYWTILLFWVPLLFLFVFCCGIGLVLSALATYFRDITHLYGVLTLAWMYATPIFYDPGILPENVLGTLQWNPMYHYITFFRSIIVYGQVPAGDVWLICIGCSVAALVLGLAIFKKLQKNFILYI